MSTTNAALASDGYKTSHRRQYPENTQYVFSNLTARSTKLANLPERAHQNKIVFYGGALLVQRFIIDFWQENFFKRPVDEVVDEYVQTMNAYLGPDNNVGSEHIRELHAIGFLPVIIEAVPEGTRVPIQVPCMFISNDMEKYPQFYWLTNYLETIISTEMWKPITSATTAYAYRKLIDEYCEKTGGTPEFVPFQGHDFSMRGMSGYWDACVSGSAHLTSFLGSDTVSTIGFINKYYRGEESEVIAMSVPASEHAVTCASVANYLEDIVAANPDLSTDEHLYMAEREFFRHMLTQQFPTGITSLVSDSYDYWMTISGIAADLKDVIMERDGKTVFRPDSGDPVHVVCGYRWDGVNYPSQVAAESAIHDVVRLTTTQYPFEVICIDGEFFEISLHGGEACDFNDNAHIEYGKGLSENEVKGSIQVLWDIFGGTVTDKGYRTLDPHVGLIYGDSITYYRCEEILRRLTENGFSSDNIVFGIGSYTYQYVTRDTYGMAVKATYAVIDGKGREIFKDPKTASGKKSAKGYLRVKYDDDGELVLKQQVDFNDPSKNDGDATEIIYMDGVHYNAPSMEDIRERLMAQ